ncbi:hypothetical protein J6590_035565 [Homalodisca vitripennis]|nr:hypothetical protein J6590_035565 [Homalodisca vitripennis]
MIKEGIMGEGQEAAFQEMENPIEINPSAGLEIPPIPGRLQVYCGDRSRNSKIVDKTARSVGRLALWIMELEQHEFEIRYRKGTLNRVADVLSRHSFGPEEITKVAGVSAALNNISDVPESPEKSLCSDETQVTQKTNSRTL